MLHYFVGWGFSFVFHNLSVPLLQYVWWHHICCCQQKHKGTVTPYPQFSAEGDVGVLDKAIKAKGQTKCKNNFTDYWETSVSLNNHAKIFLKCSGMKIHPQSDVNNPLLVCIPRQALACRWVCGSLYVFALDQLHCVGVCVCSVLSTYHSAPTPNVNSHPTALLAETPKTWALCLGDSAYYPLRVLYHGYLTGVDETTINEVLVKRSNAQRQQIKAVYMKATGKVKHTTHKLLCLCTDT